MGTRGDEGERLTEKDLLIEVLSRLRVKPLLRCKSVSKSWYALISSPNFVKSHLQRAITSCVDEKNLILHLNRQRGRLKYKKADGSFSLFNLEIGHTTTNLKFPYPQGQYGTDPPSLLVGFVCGIACVCVDDSYNFSKFWAPTAHLPTKIYLWNPAIRQSKLICPHTIHGDDGAGVALGFGFDPVDFDFKVVRVVEANSCAISAAVYSTNRDAWRNIDSKLTDVPRSTRLKVCLHGFLITIGKRGLIAFDLNKEVFVCDIKLPVYIRSVHSIYDTQDVVFKDCIAFIACMIDKPHRINLWTLDDEACLRGGGVQASWTLKLNIGLDEQFFNVQGLNNIVDLLFFSRGWWYSLDKIVSRYIYPRDIEFIYFEEDFFKYSESLLSFEGSIPVNWCADEDVDSEDEGESIEDFKYDPEERITDSEDDNESSYEDDFDESSEAE